MRFIYKDPTSGQKYNITDPTQVQNLQKIMSYVGSGQGYNASLGIGAEGISGLANKIGIQNYNPTNSQHNQQLIDYVNGKGYNVANRTTRNTASNNPTTANVNGVTENLTSPTAPSNASNINQIGNTNISSVLSQGSGSSTAPNESVRAIQKQLGIPVKFIGVGEGLDDLEPFDAQSFVNTLLE